MALDLALREVHFPRFLSSVESGPLREELAVIEKRHSTIAPQVCCTKCFSDPNFYSLFILHFELLSPIIYHPEVALWRESFYRNDFIVFQVEGRIRIVYQQKTEGNIS